jgi:hypothetical protein
MNATSENWIIIIIIIRIEKTSGVPHRGLTIYIKKYLKAKRRILKIQILNHAKI